MSERLLWPPLDDAERDSLVAEARTLVDTPWRHRGRRADRALDCIGAVSVPLQRVVLASRGVALPDAPTDYGRTPYNHRLRAELVRWFGPPITGRPQPADIVTLRWGRLGEEHHVALVVPHPHYGIGLLHGDNTAPGGRGRIVEHGWDAVWERRYVEGFRP